MKNYILIWNVNDYEDNGGGVKYELLDNILDAENRVNELTKDDKISIEFCGELKQEIKFKPVEKIIKWEIDS